MLHEMCLGLLSCARDGKCQQFESWMAEFIREHVNQKYLAIVKDVFPNMGGDVTKEEAGTITETVRPKGMKCIMFVAAVGSAIVGFMFGLFVAAIPYRKKYFEETRKCRICKQATHKSTVTMVKLRPVDWSCVIHDASITCDLLNSDI